MFLRVLTAGLALAFIACADLIPPSSDIPTYGITNGIEASRAFCARYAEACRFDPRETERVILTAATFALIEHINVTVNAEITPMTDQAHWGVADRWDYPDDGAGDCEDMQLEKRRRLVAVGLPKRALLMTVALDRDNAGHAVLTVRTDHGDYILNNLTPAVLGWRDTDLQFVQREDGRGGWVGLTGTGALHPADPS